MPPLRRDDREEHVARHDGAEHHSYVQKRGATGEEFRENDRDCCEADDPNHSTDRWDPRRDDTLHRLVQEPASHDCAEANQYRRGVAQWRDGWWLREHQLLKAGGQPIRLDQMQAPRRFAASAIW